MRVVVPGMLEVQVPTPPTPPGIAPRPPPEPEVRPPVTEPPRPVPVPRPDQPPQAIYDPLGSWRRSISGCRAAPGAGWLVDIGALLPPRSFSPNGATATGNREYHGTLATDRDSPQRWHAHPWLVGDLVCVCHRSLAGVRGAWRWLGTPSHSG